MHKEVRDRLIFIWEMIYIEAAFLGGDMQIFKICFAHLNGPMMGMKQSLAGPCVF
jgi:hypothetical protein